MSERSRSVAPRRTSFVRPAAFSFLRSLRLCGLWIAVGLWLSPLASTAEDELDGRANDDIASGENGLPPGRRALETADGVLFRDGSFLLGSVVAMVDGVLTLRRSDTEGELAVRWGRVETIRSRRRIEVVLRSGEEIVGSAWPDHGSRFLLDPEEGDTIRSVPVDRVLAIDPPETPIRVRGSVRAGGSRHEGNATSDSLFLRADVQAALGQHLLSARAAWSHAESSGELTGENVRGEGRWDVFLTERLFVFTHGSAEIDKLADVEFRSIVGAGPGYQIARRFKLAGEFTEDVHWIDRLDLRADVGLSWIHEEYDEADTRNFLSARWSARLDFFVLPNVSLFHVHEGYPSLERFDDVRIETRQGVRVDLPAGFLATAEIDWDWDNVPSPGFDRSDVLYVLTLGYRFEL